MVPLMALPSSSSWNPFCGGYTKLPFSSVHFLRNSLGLKPPKRSYVDNRVPRGSFSGRTIGPRRGSLQMELPGVESLALIKGPEQSQLGPSFEGGYGRAETSESQEMAGMIRDGSIVVTRRKSSCDVGKGRIHWTGRREQEKSEMVSCMERTRWSQLYRPQQKTFPLTSDMLAEICLS